MFKLKYLLLYIVFVIPAALATSCDSHNVQKTQCSSTQMCDDKTSTCVCITGYTQINHTYCVKPQTAPSSTPNPEGLVGKRGHGSIVALIVVPLFLTVCVIFAVFAARKYKLASWFRRKIHQRNNNYDEFMIGQDDDDPPLR